MAHAHSRQGMWGLPWLTGARMDGRAQKRAEAYRRQAAEIAKAAEEIKDSESRATLLRLVQTYMRLAEKIETGEMG